MTPEFDAIAPHPMGVDPDDLIHERSYVVRSYRHGTDGIILRGAVRDQKPAGMYIVDDPQPLTVHHMIVDLTVAMPSLEITAANAVLEVHPHSTCPRIEDHYGNLVGLSIARGFTHKVRELFGGPRGCTHTTALLQAMAPVAMQCKLASRIMGRRRMTAADDAPDRTLALSSPEMRALRASGNRNTCHVWADDGEHVAHILDGSETALPIPISVRIRERGGDPDEWRRQRWD